MWVVLIAILASILAGLLAQGKMRIVVIVSLWSIPFWFALWATITDPSGIEREFGAWWAILAFAPFLLSLWAAVTIFPFLLTAKLRKIHRGF